MASQKFRGVSKLVLLALVPALLTISLRVSAQTLSGASALATPSTGTFEDLDCDKECPVANANRWERNIYQALELDADTR